MNPFKRIKRLESQIQEMSIKLENLYRLCVSLAIIQNIHPEILKEHSQDMKKLAEYLMEMSNVKENK